MTTGEPSVPKIGAASRAVRSGAKKAAAGTSKEPHVTSSRSGATTKRAPRSPLSKREADVLDRLNRMSEPVPSTKDEGESVRLPAIVEADPTNPPIERPTARRSDDDTELDGDSSRDEDRAGGAGKADPDGEHTMAVATTTASPPARTVTPAPPADRDQSGEAPTQRFTPGFIDAPPLTELAPAVAPAPLPSLGDMVADDQTDDSTGVMLPIRPLQRPVTFKRAKPRVRRVTRVVRHVDTWSVFKVALVFNVIVYVVCLVAVVLLWNIAHATGTVDNVEKFFEQFGWESFEFNGGELYHNVWIAGLFGAIGLTGFAVVLATLFNLITDLVGGVRVSVLEEEVVARAPLRSSDSDQDDPTGSG